MALNWEDRKILGKESVELIDGKKVDVEFRDIGFVEKLNLVKKYKQREKVQGLIHESVDEIGIMIEILQISVGPNINVELFSHDIQDLYDNYFGKKKNNSEEVKKKDETSTE